jgi:integrase
VPLKTDRLLRPFPVEVFPGWLADQVSAVTEATQTPVDLAGSVALAALSTAAGGKVVVQVDRSWVESVNLYTVVALPPGTRKSPVYRAMTGALAAAQTALQESTAQQRKEAELAARIAYAKAEKLAKQAEVTTANPQEALADATQAATEADAIVVPPLPRLTTDDVTPEACAQRDSAPDDVRALLKWAAGSSKPLTDLGKPETIRAVLNAVGSKLDGKAASVTYTARRRAVLWNLCEFAVEKKHLTVNPITTIKWTRPKAHNADVVDPATVPNPQQAKALLAAVGELPGSGPRMVAFFACMYYAALRPGEAVDLTKTNLHIPKEGRGKLYLTGSSPFAGGAWTDSGEERDHRGLKHREDSAGRWAPCPPELTEILHDHLKEFGTDKNGLLFWGQRGGSLPGKTYQVMWKAARVAAFGAEVARISRLAERPYDLRHAAVSTWLASGVDPQRVADWAGHSLEVLMRVYAKCLDGEEDQAMDRIEAKLRGD